MRIYILGVDYLLLLLIIIIEKLLELVLIDINWLGVILVGDLRLGLLR
jgi:hypothetical protein